VSITVSGPVASAMTPVSSRSFYHSDADGLYARLVAAGCRIEVPPRDAEWGERFFHITDPDGHELSFARPLKRG
jgi:uncharacterized glyoxalase superfamily protein PhnB